MYTTVVTDLTSFLYTFYYIKSDTVPLLQQDCALSMCMITPQSWSHDLSPNETHAYSLRTCTTIKKFISFPVNSSKTIWSNLQRIILTSQSTSNQDDRDLPSSSQNIVSEIFDFFQIKSLNFDIPPCSFFSRNKEV